MRRVTDNTNARLEEDASELDQFRSDSRRNLFRSIAIFRRHNGPIISGSPELDSMICFGNEVLPRIRAKQRKALAHA